MSVWSIVVAAGSGSRFGGPKQLASLGGQRVIDHSLAAAMAVSDGVVVVLPADLAGDPTMLRLAGDPVVVAGGDTRSASVRAGLSAVPDEADVIVVHDGARPLAEVALFRSVIAAVRGGADAAITAVSVTDTIWSLDDGAVDRSRLRAVQTPQAFSAAALRAAHASGEDATDDATLVADEDGRVELVDGSTTNLKITRPEDLGIAETIMRGPQNVGTTL